MTSDPAGRPIGRERLAAVLRLAAAHYRDRLLQDATAKTYLVARGYDPGHVAVAYGVGYAEATSARALVMALWERANGQWPGDLREFGRACIQVGLVRVDAQGAARAFFRDRIMFPLVASGRIGEWTEKTLVVGFGGRFIGEVPAHRRDFAPPKYLNSPETALFTKSEFLYGLSWGESILRETGVALLCEGYFDVLRLLELGVRPGVVVAACGTSIGATQVALLRDSYSKGRLARQQGTPLTLYIFQDNDEAGRAGGDRTARMAVEGGVIPRLLTLGGGKDADAALADGEGVPRLRQALAGAPTPLGAALVAGDQAPWHGSLASFVDRLRRAQWFGRALVHVGTEGADGVDAVVQQERTLLVERLALAGFNVPDQHVGMVLLRGPDGVG
jgi:DNA primase